eukprot:TRINITY_DN2606_c0_g1_i11.p1 TRINITY_DN2606_c0_g1~~TRINITY_DN2606_c0_g1_i11.p1  ORF type:complete len:806 (-),score=250.28 TRINITY_DN2606_c0_g1_i11:360-2708(-)
MAQVNQEIVAMPQARYLNHEEEQMLRQFFLTPSGLRILPGVFSPDPIFGGALADPNHFIALRVEPRCLSQEAQQKFAMDQHNIREAVLDVKLKEAVVRKLRLMQHALDQNRPANYSEKYLELAGLFEAEGISEQFADRVAQLFDYTDAGCAQLLSDWITELEDEERSGKFNPFPTRPAAEIKEDEKQAVPIEAVVAARADNGPGAGPARIPLPYLTMQYCGLLSRRTVFTCLYGDASLNIPPLAQRQGALRLRDYKKEYRALVLRHEEAYTEHTDFFPLIPVNGIGDNVAGQAYVRQALAFLSRMYYGDEDVGKAMALGPAQALEIGIRIVAAVVRATIKDSVNVDQEALSLVFRVLRSVKYLVEALDVNHQVRDEWWLECLAFRQDRQGRGRTVGPLLEFLLKVSFCEFPFWAISRGFLREYLLRLGQAQPIMRELGVECHLHYQTHGLFGLKTFLMVLAMSGAQLNLRNLQDIKQLVSLDEAILLLGTTGLGGDDVGARHDDELKLDTCRLLAWVQDKIKRQDVYGAAQPVQAMSKKELDLMKQEMVSVHSLTVQELRALRQRQLNQRDDRDREAHVGQADFSDPEYDHKTCLRCMHCRRQFPNRQTLYRHLDKMYSLVERRAVRLEDVNDSFHNQLALHMAASGPLYNHDHGKYTCGVDHCHQVFSTLRDLYVHQKKKRVVADWDSLLAQLDQAEGKLEDTALVVQGQDESKHNNVDDDDEECCCICFLSQNEGASFVMLLRCGHDNICRQCAEQLVVARKPCPMCRAGINSLMNISSQ